MALGAAVFALGAGGAWALPAVSGVRVDDEARVLAQHWMTWHLGLRVGSDAQYAAATSCLARRMAERSPGPPGRVAVLRASNFKVPAPEKVEKEWGVNPLQSLVDLFEDLDDPPDLSQVELGTTLHLAIVPGVEADDLWARPRHPEHGRYDLSGPWRHETVDAWFSDSRFIADTVSYLDPKTGKRVTAFIDADPARVAFPRMLQEFLGEVWLAETALCALQAGLLAPPEALPETQGRAPGGAKTSISGPCPAPRP